jgi:uncharacterized protein (DUF1501 family)
MAGTFLLSRRSFLIGCSAAASPLLTPVTFAAAPGENRLVVIVLRGAMDGLDLLRPLGDRNYAAMRPTLLAADAPSADLDGFYALHPAASGLMPLWQAGQLAFAQAVSTPYRVGRSHFIAQDALENGTGEASGLMTARRDGWLNRAVAALPDMGGKSAVTLGPERMLILDGAAETDHWLPVADLAMSSQGMSLLSLLHGEDPAFAKAFAEAQLLADTTDSSMAPKGQRSMGNLGTFVAERLRSEARIAAFSIGGWDTHQQQARTMEVQAALLSDTILSIRAGLASAWESTLVLAVTEFGRTARENGTRGTDHGTGGMMVAAGGALNGRRVFGRWPGLGDGDLFEDRDLMPTGDVRAYAAWALRGLFGLNDDVLTASVFPGLDLGADPGLLL